MLRRIVKIDEEKCDGCGECVPNCHEGALQIIDDKARLISDLFCDGLGACLGHCPQGAITIEEREADKYDESRVMEYIVKAGKNVIIAHLKHLLEHNETDYYKEAVQYLKINGIKNPLNGNTLKEVQFSGCPGSKAISFERNEKANNAENVQRQSHLTQWPIQLHLVSPFAQYYRESDLLLAADCVGFAYADFHKDFLYGKSIAIACPKLDTNKNIYLDKLTTMIDESKIKSITVVIMQVPCCGGLLQIAELANKSAKRKVPVNRVVVGVNGEILEETLVA
jgi:ferredoxin